MLNSHDSKTSTEIKSLAEFLGLNEFVIEKDFYVTQAIGIVGQINNPNFDIIFQGGTSLAKAHRVIERMSEDCDFRIVLKDSGQKISRDEKRKMLRNFRNMLISKLKTAGFFIDEDSIAVRNEGQFIAIRASYLSAFSHVDLLKPFILLEFFLSDVKIEPEKKPVTTLIQQVFGDKVNHPTFLIASIAVVETAAEKWVGLTRRIATSAYRKYYHDKNLVRHLYDLYQIDRNGYFSDEFYPLASRIVMEDREHYKSHNNHYYEDPIREIKCAIDTLHNSVEWRENWEQFTTTMVFSREKVNYSDALKNLDTKTARVFEKLELEVA